MRTTRKCAEGDDLKKNQLVNTKANSNKPILWLRNVIEHVINLYTMKFPRLRVPLNLRFACHIEQIMQIITAYLIEYQPPLRKDSEWKEEYAREIIRRIDNNRSNLYLKEISGSKGWQLIARNTNAFRKFVLNEKWLPKIILKELEKLNCGTYQVNRANTYIVNSHKKLMFRIYNTNKYKDSTIIKVTNIKSKYHRGTTRTTLLEFKKKDIKQQPKPLTQHLYHYINWYCNCSYGTCTITACSHVIMILKIIYLCQNRLKIKASKIYTTLFKNVINCEGFNLWAIENKLFCVCLEKGVNKNTMIKCRGCRFWYHPKCVILDEEYRKEVESYIGKRTHYWCCKDECAYKRDDKLRRKYFENKTKRENKKKKAKNN